MDKSLIDDLNKMGLSTYESKVYLALLERSSLDTADVARISGVPRARTYDVLDSLVNRGLASLRPGKQKRYSASDIVTFKQKLLEGNRQEFLDREKKIKKVSMTLKRKLESMYPPGSLMVDPLEYIEIIKSPQQMHKSFMEFVGETKKEILMISKPPYSGSKEKLEEQYNQQAGLLQQGIKIKCIYEIPGKGDEIKWWYNSINTAASFGEEARISKELPMKMAIFDERIVMLPLVDPVSSGTSFTTQIVQHSSLAKSLKILFETLWERSEDYHILEDQGSKLSQIIR